MPVPMRTPEGQTVFVDEDQVRHAVNTGYVPISTEDLGAATTERDRGVSGLAGAATAGATALASGATLGLSDVGIRALASKGTADYVGAARAAHPIVSGVSQAAGMIAPALVAPESFLSRTPAGYLAHTASAAADIARASGGLTAAAEIAGISGAEAAAQNAGMYLSDVALGDRDLTVEGMGGALGTGFAFGSMAGGAVYGIERGTMAARRMFSRVMDADASMASKWSRTSDEILTAHDETAQIARKKLDDIKTQRAAAQDVKVRADAEIARAKLDQFNAPAVEVAAKPNPMDFLEKYRVAPDGTQAAMPEVAGPTGETQVAQTSSAPRFHAAPSGSTLEEQLGAMKAQIDTGATLQDLNAARMSPAQEQKLTETLDTYAERRAAVNEWVAKLKNPRTAYDTEGSAASIGEGRMPSVRGRTVKALNEDVFVEQSGGNIRTIGQGEHTLADVTPNTRILARSNADSFSRGTVLDDAYNDAIERAHLGETAAERDAAMREAADIEQQIHAYVRSVKPENASVIDQIEKTRAAAGRTGYHAAFARAERRATDLERAAPGKLAGVNAEQEAAYQEALAGKGPRGPVDVSWLQKYGHGPLIQDVHEAAQVVGAYEKAAADLVEAIGPEAPPVAQKAAKAYRDAEDTATRKQMDRTARAVDDHVQFGPINQTPAQRIAENQGAKLEASATLGQLKTQEADIRATLPRSQRGVVKQPPTPPLTKPTRFQRMAHTAEKVGAGLELASMAGIPGVPHPSDIPVIGPLLGAYLKFRAFTGKLAGRLPATGEARAAALASKVKDRTARSVDRMLGLVEKSAPAARGVAVAATTRAGTILAHRLFDDGRDGAGKDASSREQCAVRVRELSAAVANPQSVLAQVRKQMSDVTDPDLIAAAEKFQMQRLQYLHDNAPKQPPPEPLAQKVWLPNPAPTASFARRVEVANDPEVALAQVEQGAPTIEAAETLRAVYPNLFMQLQQRLLQRATEIEKAVPYRSRQAMSILYDVPLDRLSEPATIAMLQSFYAPNQPNSPAAPSGSQPAMPSIAGPVDLGSQYQTASDRRSARR